VRRSIQARLLALVAAGVFVAGAALAVVGHASLKTLEHEAARERERLAGVLASGIAAALDRDMTLLAAAAAAPHVDLEDDDQSAERAALDTAAHYARLVSITFFVAPDGSVAAAAPAGDLQAVSTLSAARAALESIRSQRPIVTDVIRDERGRDQVFLVIPYRDGDGRPAGAAAGAIDLTGRRLVSLLQPDATPGVDVELLDGTGRLLARTRVDRPGRTAAAEGGEAAAQPASRASVRGTRWAVALAEDAAPSLAAIRTFRRRWFWLAPSLVGIATLLGWGIARSIRLPLMELTDAAERIAHGDLRQAVAAAHSTDGGDEVTRLASALERMRSSLQASIEGIERANRDLETRVAERTAALAAANARLEDRERWRQRLLRQVISAQEDERKRIARELHDETSQTLAALGMGVDAALATATGAATLQRLSDLRRLVTRMYDGLRRLIVHLRPSVLDDLGLAAGIQWLANELTAQGVAVRCELAGLERRLPPEVETAVFRAVQEALANVARHANADSVLIQGACEDGWLRIEVEDDGVGFDPARAAGGVESLRGVGLLGMRERIEILGGSLTLESAPGAGTRILMMVPHESQENERWARPAS
jgi:signal transduction histidine kinase